MASILSYPDEFKQRYELLKDLGSGDYSTVYLTFDKIRNRLVAMKIVAGSPEYSFLAGSEESSINGLKKVRAWTDGVPEVYEAGAVSGTILGDYPYIVPEFMYQEVERYFNTSFDEIPVEDIDVDFLTMTYCDQGDFLSKLSDTTPHIDANSSDQNLGFMFELIYIILVLDVNEIEHGDLNAGNVVATTAPYKRQYTINGIPFTIPGSIMPVIIDWAEPTGNMTGGNKTDLQKLIFELKSYYGITLPTEIETMLMQNDFQALMADLFARFRNVELTVGDAVKFYQPLDFE